MYRIIDTKSGKLMSGSFSSKMDAKKVRDEKNINEHGEKKYNETEELDNGNIIYPNRYGCRFKVCRTDKHPKGASYKKVLAE